MPGPLARLSLNLKFPLLIAALLLGAVAVFAAIAYREVSRGAEAQAATRLRSIAGQLADMVGPQGRAIMERTTRAASDSAIMAFAAGKDPAEAALAALSRSGTDTAQVAAMEIRGPGGALLLADRARGTRGVAAAAAAPERGDSAAVGPLFVFGDSVYFEVSAPIRMDGSLRGQLVERRRLSSSPEGVERLAALIGTDATLLLGNRDHTLWTDFWRPVEALPPADQHRRRALYRRNGQWRLGAAVPVEGTPWMIAAEFPRERVLAGSRAILWRFAGAGAIILALGAVLGWGVSRRITRPLLDLTAAAETVAWQPGTNTRDSRRGDEIARLGRAFRTMVARVQEGQVQLRTSEEQYRLLFERNPNPMWVFDTTTLAFLAVNDAAVRRYGYPRERFLEMTIADIRPAAEAPLQAAELATPGAGPRVWRHQTRAGDFIDVEVTGQALIFAGRQAELVLAHDVTERARLESQLRQAQKMEAIGRLAGGIAHDFNNMLSAIIGNADLLSGSLPAGDPALADVREIKEAADRAAELTRQLLAFSRQQVLQPQVLSVNEVVTGVEKMLRRVIGEDVELIVTPDPAARNVKADRGQLEQILLNLAVNARDAMPAGGKLIIETANAELDAVHAGGHPMMPAGDYVLLAVSDTGAGMSAEQQARIFEPFYTTKEKGKGTGLGLATVYGIVKQSGGSIWVYSEPGRGATFKIYLPSVDEPATSAPAVAAPGNGAGGNETILLVEDEDAVRRVGKEILLREGYAVHAVAGPEEALRFCEAHPGGIDLIATDLVMPGMGGRELAQRLRVLHPEARVLYLSGYTDGAVVQQGMLIPGTAFLQKPFSAAVLSRTVRAVLDAPPDTA